MLHGGSGGNLPVNWPKLFVPFTTDVPPVFDLYMFGMSFYIISVTKNSDIFSKLCFRSV